MAKQTHSLPPVVAAPFTRPFVPAPLRTTLPDIFSESVGRGTGTSLAQRALKGEMQVRPLTKAAVIAESGAVD